MDRPDHIENDSTVITHAMCPSREINLYGVNVKVNRIFIKNLPSIEAMYIGMPSEMLSGLKPKAEMKNT